MSETKDNTSPVIQEVTKHDITSAVAVAAMTLLAIAGTNWGVRLVAPDEVLPHGLALSVLASIFTGIAGWHGGKLVFDHGVGLMVSPKK